MSAERTVRDAVAALDREAAGREMHELVRRAYPICRSITGPGVRETLAIAREIVPLEVHEVPSGTPVLDWEVPPEWSVRGAWIEGPDGCRVVDFADHNLHLVSYSVPVDRRLSRAELDEHLHSLPEQPDLIPYRTSYYRETWGFCLPHKLRQSLPDGEYRVVVDSTLAAGSLTYGELLLPGEERREVLVSCHVCHPSLANDNLSSLAVTLWLARQLAACRRRWSYRFVWAPGTIGAIVWLAQHRGEARRIAHGLVAANLGDAGGFHYKRSRRGDALIDRAVEHVLATAPESAGEEHAIEDFAPFGYDERQYCSPGFDLPVGLLSRTPWGRYPEYHTSADDCDLVQPEALAGSLARYLEIFAVLEGDRRYRNLSPHGEPQLGRRGLYGSLGGGDEGRDGQLALLWVLNLSDGEHGLLDIARRSGLPFAAVEEAALALTATDLLEELS